MLKSLLILLLATLGCEVLYGQTKRLEGQVTDSAGTPLAHASILLKYAEQSAPKIQYALSDTTGHFSFPWDDNYSSPVLEITVLGYKKFTGTVDPGKMPLRITLSSSSSLLPSVVVTNKFGIRVSGDTTTFNTSRFSNKNEQSIEDLLKKMPGFDVDNEGNIKFNGRQIEKVLIEGDDLYGSDFKMLTRNLSPDAVEQIQAIDNYNENPLLKGLVKTNKQVLNLKLKKKVLFSGNVDAGGGIPHGRYDNRVNLLSITPVAKVTVLGNMNNIGVSPFSFTTADKPDPVNMSRSLDITAEKIMPVAGSVELNYQGIDARRSNINRSKIINASFLARPIKDLSVKGSTYFIGEKTDQQQLRDITYLITSPPVNFTESTLQNKKQSFQSAKLEMEYLHRKKQLFEYDFKYEHGTIDQFSAMQLKTGNLSTSLATEKKHMENRFHYTNRFNNETALDAEVLYNHNQVPQQLRVDPVPYAALLGLDADSLASLYQQSNNPVKQFSAQTRLVGAKENWNYELNVGYHHFDRDFQAAINGIDTSGDTVPAAKPYQSGYPITDQSYFTELAAWYKAGSFKFDGSTTFTRGHYRLDGQVNNYNYFKHRFTTSYKFKQGGILNLLYSYKKDPPELTSLLPAWWMTTYRNFRSGVNQFSLAPQHVVSLNYALADFFKKQLLAYCGAVYMVDGERYIDDVVSTTTYQTARSIPYTLHNENIVLYARMEKYIRGLSGNLILDVNNTWGSYLNQTSGVNNYIRFTSSDFKLGFKSIWEKFNVLLQSTVKLRHQKVNSQLFNRSSDNLYQESRLSLYYMPNSRLNFEWKAEYYLMPDGDKHRSYLFLDFNAQYSIIRDKLVLNLIGSNLSNVRELTFNTISPTQTATQRFNLLERYAMLKVHYAF